MIVLEPPVVRVNGVLVREISPSPLNIAVVYHIYHIVLSDLLIFVVSFAIHREKTTFDIVHLFPLIKAMILFLLRKTDVLGLVQLFVLPFIH